MSVGLEPPPTNAEQPQHGDLVISLKSSTPLHVPQSDNSEISAKIRPQLSAIPITD